MNFLTSLLIIIAWWIIFYVAGFLEKKLPAMGYAVVRWLMVLPLAILGYFSGPLFWDMGLFWPVASYPLFVLVGMYVAPTRRWLPGALLMILVVFSAFGEIRRAWEMGKTRRWIFTGTGLVLAGGVFWKMRNLDGD